MYDINIGNKAFKMLNSSAQGKDNVMKATSKLRVGRWLLTLCIGGGTASVAFGQIYGTATLNGTPNGSGAYNYTIQLKNTGTTDIGTFWYAWIPGEFYLPTEPSSASAPAGWTATMIQAPSAAYGYPAWSVRYTADSSADYLTAGGILNFVFSSTDAPATLAGNSTQFPAMPIGTSYLYSQGPFAGSSYQLVVETVPEPSVLDLLAAGFFGLASVWWWKLRRCGPVIG